jgi:mannose-6-phosphate isomerase class I
MKKSLIHFTENRVRRNYCGGSGLDRFNGKLNCLDSDRPEDWIASTVFAENPGLAPIANEGLAKVSVDGVEQLFIDFLAGDPGFYLGRKHVEKHGVNLGFLAKLLDSSMRLHVQAHPTAEFARKYLDSRFGKLECYYILGCREDVEPYIRFGFQHPPSPEEWTRIVFEQDIKAENYSLQRLIGNRHTPCFEILKMIVRKTCSAVLDERFYVGICLNGKGLLQADDEHMRMTRSSRFFIPAAVEELQIQLDSSREDMEMILCLPGKI